MEVKILTDSANELQATVDNLTIVELLRVYLNRDDSVVLAAWRREHPTKPPILLVKTKGKSPRKALADSVKAIEKDLDKLESDFKKLK